MAVSKVSADAPRRSARIGFIGAGRMAGAMIDGLIAKGVYGRSEIVACAPSESSRERMAAKCGIRMFEKAADMAPMADTVVLACKPKNIPPLFENEGLALVKGQLLVSIAAGVRISTLQKYVPDAKIVRVMPNHCCMVLEGAAGYVMGPGCTEEDRKTVDEILGAIGLSVEVKEEDLDAVTGIAGSSPAFIYMMARALVEAGKKYGLSEEQSVRLAGQSLAGAGHMVLESGMGLDDLIDGVCSPGGTTVEGCKVLEKEGFEDAVVRCVDATVARSIEMGRQ